MVSLGQPFDVAAKGTWPITLGDSITATKKAARLTSVRYNSQPPKSALRRSIRLVKGNECEAIIEDKEEQEWKYAGNRAESSTDYVLILHNDAGRKEARLERLDAVTFNLCSTPYEQDSAVLRKKYKQLAVSADEEDDIHDLDDITPQADNPFDYRHFLVDDADVQPEQTRMSSSTPSLRAVGRTVTTAAKKSVQAAQPTAKRARNPTQTKTQVPAVRLERKASTRPTTTKDDNDDGELILENGEDDAPSKTNRSRPSAMSMALNGQLGRPISLHSAASSPGSIVNSPAPERPDDVEIDLGASDIDMHDADGDVDDFELPSPVQHTSNKNLPPPVEDDDEDDDFTKELTMAMEQDDVAPVVPALAPEDEESEEE